MTVTFILRRVPIRGHGNVPIAYFADDATDDQLDAVADIAPLLYPIAEALGV